MGKNIYKDEMYIVYASDDNFSDIMGVSILSLFENNKDENINIYILDSNISKDNKDKIESICVNYSKKLPMWIQAKNINDVLGINVEMDRGSLSQYARLFIGDLLDKDIKRVLYLDCDTIIEKSIKDLWNIDLEGNTIAALKDAFSSRYRANIRLKPNDIMFNSGVMLIDMLKWKENRIEDRLLKLIKKNNGIIQQGDQGALNSILSKQTLCINPKYNAVTIFFDFTYENMLIYRKPPNFYSKGEIKKAIEDPVIIHYTTSFISRRPWVEGCNHKYKDRYLYYKNKSPWSNEPFRQYKAGVIKRLFIKIFNIMPYYFSIRFASILQVYIRPIVNRVKLKRLTV